MAQKSQPAVDPSSDPSHRRPSLVLDDDDDESGGAGDEIESMPAPTAGDGKATAISSTANEEPPAKKKKTRGRVKIEMQFIHDKMRRYTTFSKRKSGIMKKAYELSTLTGTQVLLLVASETGHVYTFATPKLQPMITSETGKALIQTCLNSPDLLTGPNERMSSSGFEETELTYGLGDAQDATARDHVEATAQNAVASQTLPTTASAPIQIVGTSTPSNLTSAAVAQGMPGLTLPIIQQAGKGGGPGAGLVPQYAVQATLGFPNMFPSGVSLFNNPTILAQIQQQQQQQQLSSVRPIAPVPQAPSCQPTTSSPQIVIPSSAQPLDIPHLVMASGVSHQLMPVDGNALGGTTLVYSVGQQRHQGASRTPDGEAGTGGIYLGD
eukprot:m.309478 g.309478  ORF g.309478 m.309478 type:complete len:381 (+) comp46618_c0_seq1:127-1269(+)